MRRKESIQLRQKRCAIYTRKSVEEGLDMEYNSLDAQRDAGESYVASQKSNGWVCLPDRYDDGGFSGGNVNRPALKQLMEDCHNGKVDVVVVYKIDRLSRSIADFADLTKKFDEYGVSFCAVTQDINTATSAGRMMVNILITFALYEREVIAERIRDKVAASKKKGIWMGGRVPLGYKVVERRLVIVPEEAETVRRIFRRYYETQSPFQICNELNADGLVKKSGKPWEPKVLNKMLRCCTYIGKLSHHGDIYEGEHEAIIDMELWNSVQAFMDANAGKSRPGAVTRNSEYVAPLRDILRCGCCDGSMAHYVKHKNGVAYSYYKCVKDANRTVSSCQIRQIPAKTVEDAVFARLTTVLRTPEFLEILSTDSGVGVASVGRMLGRDFWDAASALEKQRLCSLLLDKVTLFEDRIDMVVRTGGMRVVMEELGNE